MNQNHKSSNNTRVLSVGFFLILLVLAIFFLKDSFFGNKNKSQNQANSSSQNDNTNLNKYGGISAKDLIGKINSQEVLTIIDLRDSAAYKMEHIKDSKNISPDDLAANVSALDKNGEYFFVDETDLTPGEIQALDAFTASGIKNAFYLEGGMAGWKSNFNPTVSSGDPYSIVDQSKVNYIKSDDLKKLMGQNNNIFIIDVRTGKEFSDGHLKGAVNIYLDDLENHYKEIPLGRKIILSDNDGMWAFQAAVRLYDLGIANVFALSDGLNAWKQKGFEIVK
jgi:rhodanese-related sulfurtransferase